MRAPVTSALLLLALLQSACEDSPKPAPSAPSASVATTTTPTASAAAAVPTPEPLDVAALDAALKCGGKGHGPCAVLQDFHDCIEWNPVTAGGDARWLGEGYVVSGGAFVDQLTLLRSKRVPTTDVGPGQLPVRIGVAAIPDDMAANGPTPRRPSKLSSAATWRARATRRSTTSRAAWIGQRLSPCRARTTRSTWPWKGGYTSARSRTSASSW